MIILHLSVTHGQHRSVHHLPDADIIVHSGDFTVNGTEEEAIDFINWLSDLPYENKIFISGNHDECLYGANVEGLDSNVHYLCNSGIEISGIKFFGVPMFMQDCITDRQSQNYTNIPLDTDVLITHSPAFGILDFDDDTHYGSKELLTRISSMQLSAHLFGHIHSQHGIKNVNSTAFSNGSVTDFEHFIPQLLSIPVSEIPEEKAKLNYKDTYLSEFPNYEFNIWVQRDDSNMQPHNLHIYSFEEDFEIIVDIETCVVLKVIKYGSRRHDDKFADIKTKLKDWFIKSTLMSGRIGTNYDTAIYEYDACNETLI